MNFLRLLSVCLLKLVSVVVVARASSCRPGYPVHCHPTHRAAEQTPTARRDEATTLPWRLAHLQVNYKLLARCLGSLWPPYKPDTLPAPPGLPEPRAPQTRPFPAPRLQEPLETHRPTSRPPRFVARSPQRRGLGGACLAAARPRSTQTHPRPFAKLSRLVLVLVAVAAVVA
jgi:hypothetical protein